MKFTTAADQDIIEKMLEKKYRFFEDFWAGQGSCPILFSEPHLAKGRAYRKHDLVEQHGDVDKLLEDNLLDVEPHLDLIDDGIPTIRPDLGTTLLPSGLGLEIEIQPDQHPWLKSRLSVPEYLSLPELDEGHIQQGEIPLATEFYSRFEKSRAAGAIRREIMPYVPDTQGIFDLSHLIIGSDLLLLCHDRPELVHRVQERSLELFLTATRLFKRLVGEGRIAMVHGHGMPIGVWFPDTGARISEDSATLISDVMIGEFCLPYIRRAVQPFGRGFLHFCGHHPGFLKMVCRMPEISTLNLGNPESYDLEELFALCGETGTVYFGHLPLLGGEDGPGYLERLADLCRRTGSRLILVSEYKAAGREEKSALVKRWHNLTRLG